MASDQEKAIALLGSMVAPHDQPDPLGEDHEWRKCRTCLAHEMAETREGRRLLGLVKTMLDDFDQIHEDLAAGVPPGCQVCHGEKGGAPGNEQRVDGKLVCDYCHAAMRPAVPPGSE